ncbi:MAG: right-handed parallel beta-helix repeat-containing protein [Phycisphaeraceae bacterium]|nr:right-handed parallel beta-helix repeat-containing protein [Phycisphaeraceae bacterium]
MTPRNRQHLVLKDLKDVRIMAIGVEMICTETTRALTIENCQNLTLKGMVIDYDPLPYTQGRIVKLSENNTVHDIELFGGYPEADEIQNFKYEIFKADTRTLRFGSYFEFRVVDKQADRIRVRRGNRYHGEQVGDIIAIGTSHAPGGQIPHAIYTTRSRHVVLEDVTLYASNCFGFFETECEKTTYLHCRVDRRAAKDDFKARGDPRIRSLDADAFHSKHATIGPQLIGCTARFQADDCVNICGDYHMVMACDGPKLRVLAKGRINIEPGDPLEVVGYAGQRLADARAISVTRQGNATTLEQTFMRRQRMHQPFREGSLRQIYEVVIDRPADLAQGSVIAAANRIGNGFKVTQCDFGFNRSRGILIKASHGEVSNNRLEGCVEEAIKVAPEFWWLEAGSSNDVRIIGNSIQHCGGMGIAVYAEAGAGGMAPAGAHNNIVIEGNLLRDVAGREIWVTSTRGLTLRNNDFGDTEPDIKLEHCEAVSRGRGR